MNLDENKRRIILACLLRETYVKDHGDEYIKNVLREANISEQTWQDCQFAYRRYKKYEKESIQEKVPQA